MNYETIKTELTNKGYSMSMIAAALDCSPVNVQQVCKGMNNSYRVAKAVSVVLEKPIEEIFPGNVSYHHVLTFTDSREERIQALAQRLAS